MSEEKTPYNAGDRREDRPEHIDEYYSRGLGPGEFEVYRKVGTVEMRYCTCDSPDAALLIARALNFTAAFDGRIVETISYSDGSIFLMVKGSQAEQAYLKARPILKGDQ